MDTFLRNQIDVVEIDLIKGDNAAITEDLTGNTYDSGLWTLYNGGSPATDFRIDNERIEGDFGCCISGNDVNYEHYQFYLTKLSEPETDIDIRGKLWRSSALGNRSPAIGFWSVQNYYVLIAASNVFGTAGKIQLLIRNGEGTTGGSTTFTYLADITSLDATVEREYRITYTRSNNEIKFYYYSAGSWIQMGTTQVVDFGSRQFRLGAFHGIFNTTGGGTGYNDAFEIYYTAEGDIAPGDIETKKYISTNTPIQILNRYYGYKPLIKSVNDLPAEIKEKDTVTRRLKVTFIDTLELVASDSIMMASYWRMFIAAHKNYKGRIIRYYRRLGEGDLELRFVGKIDNITIDTKGNTTFEAIDLMKALSKIKYPFVLPITLATDMVGVFRVDTYEELAGLNQAVPDDYGLVTGYVPLAIAQVQPDPTAGTLTDTLGFYYYFAIVAYAGDKPVARNLVSISLYATGKNSISFSLDAPSSALPGITVTSIKIFGGFSDGWNENYLDLITELVTEISGDSGTFILSSWGSFTEETPPVEAEKYYILTDPDFSNLANWDYVNDPQFTADIEGDITLLNDSGYLKIDEEIFYYDHITSDSEGYTLIGVERGLFGTESPRHTAGTILFFIIAQAEPIDIFEMMKLVLAYGGIDDIYIHSRFDTYALLNILDVTTLPIIQETDLSEIYFDLVNLADCMSFQNEDGLIEILMHSEDPAEEILLTDEANLIYNTVSLDLNEESRLTRWILFWNRFNLDEDLDSNEAYGRGNITIDDVQEDFYGDVEQEIQHSTFLNGETDLEISDASDYANALLLSRRDRTREAQWKVSAQLEIKDDSIKLGQIVFIKTRNVLNSDGTIPTLTYRVIKKEPSGNKIKFTFIRIIIDSTTES